MSGKGRHWVILAIIALVVPSLAGIPRSAMADIGNTEIPESCLPKDGQGGLVWKGEPSAELKRMEAAAEGLLERHPNQLTGVAYCSDYSGVVVAAKRGISPTLVEQLKKLNTEHSGFALFLNPVDFSKKEIDSFVMRLSPVMDSVLGVVGFGPDYIRGRVSVEYDIQGKVKPDKMRSQIQTGLATADRASVPVVLEPGHRIEVTATRWADRAPYYMGAVLKQKRHGRSSYCSAGVPIVVNGARRLLTAGHCRSKYFFNNGYLVGSQYTTSYPGNAYKYGDFKLLKGNRYGMKVFNGRMNSGSSLRIVGGYYSGLGSGNQLCVSGATTAQTCRYYVIRSNRTYYIWNGQRNIKTGHLTVMYHDSNRDGRGDKYGFRPGDSGGPAYSSAGGGKVRVAGIATGAGHSFRHGKLYYVTQLSGVRQWNRSAYVG